LRLAISGTFQFVADSKIVARCRRLGRRRSKVGAVVVVVVVAAMAHRLLLSVATARALVADVRRRAISAAVGASR
jgi:hypothetical protein